MGRRMNRRDDVRGFSMNVSEEDRTDDDTLLYQVIYLVLYYRVIGVKVPLVYLILNSNT
jgi:hypothetical protein